MFWLTTDNIITNIIYIIPINITKIIKLTTKSIMHETRTKKIQSGNKN